MKLLVGLLLVSLAISSTFALPARNPNDDAEVISVPRGPQGSRQGGREDTDVEPDFTNFKGVVDTGSGYPFFSPLPYNPFSFNTGYFDNFEDIFKRLRESLLTRIWSDVEEADEDGLGIDPSKGNSTSIVKVVDGHKVEINDTVYTNADKTGNAVFKVRVIQIRPVDSEEDVGATDGTNNATGTKKTNNSDNEKGSPEVMEKPGDNEINNVNIDSSEVKPASRSR